MIVHILLFPFILALCYVVPFVSTTFSKKNNLKWLSFWLISLFVSFTIIPLLNWLLGQEITLVFSIMLSTISMILLNNQKCEQIFGLIGGVVEIIKEQTKMIKQNVSRTLKQYGLIQ